MKEEQDKRIFIPSDAVLEKYQAVTAEELSSAVEQMLSHPPAFVAFGDVGQAPAFDKICEMFSLKTPDRPGLSPVDPQTTPRI